MKKKTWWKYLLPIAAVLLVLAVILYFVHPIAPLLLLFSVMVQIPIIWAVAKANINGSYRQRAQARRTKFEEDGDAEEWLRAEQAEADSVAVQYWSARGKSLLALNRAEALATLGRMQEAATLLAEAQPDKLEKADRERHAQLEKELQQYFAKNQT